MDRDFCLRSAAARATLFWNPSAVGLPSDFAMPSVLPALSAGSNPQ